MSRMLIFALGESAMTIARTHAQSGRCSRALDVLNTALAGGELSIADTVDAHRLAAQILNESERFRLARRHLQSALRLSPRHADLHYELGMAYQNDPYGCDRRAAARFRAAVAFEPDSAIYRAALGRALIRLNRVRSGVRELRHAVTLAPTDWNVLSVAVDGLREADRPQLAQRWVEAALFQLPNSASLRGLWNRVRFDAARAVQQESFKVLAPTSLRPATLPFMRVATESATGHGTGGIVRADVGSRPTPHFNRLRAYRAEPG